jgi:hypothetical protein
VAPRGGAAPEGDPVGIDLGAAARIRDGGGPVLELGRDRVELSRLPLARAEVTVVEGEHGEAGSAIARGVVLEAGVLRAAEPVPHDDAGHGRARLVREVQPRVQQRAVDLEAHVRSGDRRPRVRCPGRALQLLGRHREIEHEADQNEIDQDRADDDAESDERADHDAGLPLE